MANPFRAVDARAGSPQTVELTPEYQRLYDAPLLAPRRGAESEGRWRGSCWQPRQPFLSTIALAAMALRTAAALF